MVKRIKESPQAAVPFSYLRGAQPLAHGPNVAHRALESPLQGSPRVRKFGAGGAVAVLPPLPCCQNPKLHGVEGSWATTLPPHGQIRVGAHPLLSVRLGWGQPMPLFPPPSWGQPMPPSLHTARLGPSHAPFPLQGQAMSPVSPAGPSLSSFLLWGWIKAGSCPLPCLQGHPSCPLGRKDDYHCLS